MQYDIVIIDGDTATHNLVLNPSGTLEVKRGDKVNWSIATAKVKSFRIEKKEKSKDIFALLDKPPKKHTKKGSGKIGHYPKDHTIYDYSIWWIPEGGEDELEYDPKILIMPSTDPEFLLQFMVAAVSAIIGLLTFIFLNKRFRKD